MRKQKSTASIFVIVALFGLSCSSSRAQTSEPRLALVIGNAQYRTGPLATAANDAGLIAQTLTTAGFDVTGAADLDQDSMRRAFKEFIGKVQAAGPHAISFVYLAGYGLQYSGENYFVPVDAALQRDSDIPIEAIRISDFTHALAGLPLDARIFVLDAARANPFPVKGNPLAGGLALIDVEDGALDAFNAAPGTIAPVEQGPYGIYARALAEMLRYGGMPLDEAFARTRLRVNELAHGAFVPWDASKLARPLILLAANPEAEPPPQTQSYAALRSRPIGDFPSANEAYAAAIEIDTLAAYQAFLQAYPSDPLAYRVRALLAARREALTWNRTVMANTPDAYWTYMRRYPRGPHFYDARRRLAGFSAPLEPPPRFDLYDYQGLPPPPDDEYIIVDRPEILFEGPDYAPAPPPPAYFLAPPPPEFRRLPAPEPSAVGILPAPQALPLPFARPAARQGGLSQPAVAPNAQAPTQAPNAVAVPQGVQSHPAIEQNHGLPVPAQGGPGLLAPQLQPGHPEGQGPHQLPAGEPGAVHSNGLAPNALPEPHGAGHPEPLPGHALPGVTREPSPVASPAASPAVPHVQREHATPQVALPHPAVHASPQAAPQHQPRVAPARPAPAPHVAAPPPYVAPRVAPAVAAPRVVLPHPVAPHPAAAPPAPHPAAPPAPHPAPAVAHPPAPAKPAPKPGEPPH